MTELKTFLLSLPKEHLWIVGGVVAEVLLQGIKRYIWQPPDEAKAKKIVAAVMVSVVLAVGTEAAGLGQFAAAWLGIFLSAIGYHEATDKLGLKRLWSQAVSRGTFA
ncbi:MAG: hypothetical protein R6V19_00115 [Armatimonadota bacterium]